MTSRDELIEKARVAFVEAWEAEHQRIENWDRDSRGKHTRSRAGIEAAFAIFEQESAKDLSMSPGRVKNGPDSSHVEQENTPTTDEREALAGVIRDADMALPSGALALAEWSRHLAGSILTAGFRRPEVPRRTLDEAVQARDWDTVRRLQDEAEPQSEPTDDQVRSALSAWFQRMIAGGWDNTHEERMRAALRAAFKAGGEER